MKLTPFKRELFTYEQIRQLALADGITDNKVSVGMWARIKGYYKTRKMVKGKSQLMYYIEKNDVEIASIKSVDRETANIVYKRINKSETNE